MSTQEKITFHIGAPQGRTTFGRRNGKPVVWIGWLYTGDRHPTEIRATGGEVTGIPKKDGRPLDAGRLWRAWQINAHDDHVYQLETKFGLTGWFAAVFVPVNVDETIAEILAAAQTPNDACDTSVGEAVR